MITEKNIFGFTKPLKICIIISFAFLMHLKVIAQIENYEQIVIDLFESNNVNVSVEYFTGKFENAHPLNLAYAIVDNDVKGIYRFQGEEMIFYLDGQIKNDSLLFLITDEFEENCGFIKLQRNDDILQGKWINLNQTKNYNLFFKRGKKDGSLKKSQWLKKYSSKNNGAYESFTFEKMENNEVEVRYYSSILNQEQNFQTSCKNTECDNFELSFKNVYQPIEIVATISPSEQLNLIYKEAKGDKLKNMDLEVNLSYAPIQKLSYSYRIDAFLPTTQFPVLDDYIVEKSFEIMDSFENKIHSIEDVEGLTPSMHLRYELLGWSEIDYISPAIISGKMIFINNENKKAKSFYFNFDISKNKLFTISDQIKKEFLLDPELQKLLKEETEKQMENKSEFDREWIESIEIKPNNFNETGIIFSSEYNLKNGEIKVVVPFQLFSEDGFKRNNLLQKMITF